MTSANASRTGGPVQVEWTDSQASVGIWETIDDMEPMKPTNCVSVGFIVDETEEYITLAMTRNEYQLLARLTIPKAVIRKKKVLR